MLVGIRVSNARGQCAIGRRASHPRLESRAGDRERGQVKGDRTGQMGRSFAEECQQNKRCFGDFPPLTLSLEPGISKDLGFASAAELVLREFSRFSVPI